jgi:hypothetical protein
LQRQIRVPGQVAPNVLQQPRLGKLEDPTQGVLTLNLAVTRSAFGCVSSLEAATFAKASPKKGMLDITICSWKLRRETQAVLRTKMRLRSIGNNIFGFLKAIT